MGARTLQGVVALSVALALLAVVSLDRNTKVISLFLFPARDSNRKVGGKCSTCLGGSVLEASQERHTGCSARPGLHGSWLVWQLEGLAL